jgi:branched-chain amino acid transport system substrate-binding protein
MRIREASLQRPRRIPEIIRASLTIAAMAGFVASLPGAATAADALKLGIITTQTGPGAIIGTQMNEGMQIAIDELGGKIGGLTSDVRYVDDQAKPEAGRQVADELLTRDKVDFITGAIWTNVLMAIYTPIVRTQTFLIGANAGPSEIAGKMCSPYFFSASVQNDQESEAMGAYLTEKKVDNLFIVAPNFGGGRDNVAGLKRYYKGAVAGEVYLPLTQQDFATELSQIGAAHPGAVYAFTPGAMGVQFVNQFAQAGLKDKVPLYTVYTTDETNLAAQRDAAIGIYETRHWNHDLDNPTNKAFVQHFQEKYHGLPTFYAAEGYDAIMMIDGAVRAVKGDLTNKAGIRAALEKADFKSVRGDISVNTNHFLIQNFYLVKIVKGSDGSAEAKTVATIFKQKKDPYYEECQMK